MEENKNVGFMSKEKKIKLNPANVIIRTALIHQLDTGVQWICDAVSLLLQGDFTCKGNLEEMSEYAERIMELLSAFEVESKLV